MDLFHVLPMLTVQKTMIVQLIKITSKTDEYEIESLTVGKKYEVIEIADDYYRIISEDDKEPYLYPADCFKIIDNVKPAFWVTEVGDDGEKYCSPPNWNEVGFWEDYFDDVEKVRKQFWKEYRKYYKQNGTAKNTTNSTGAKFDR